VILRDVLRDLLRAIAAKDSFYADSLGRKVLLGQAPARMGASRARAIPKT
jgi:hypothetical protein